MSSIAICFGQFGPYHHARVDALQRIASAQGIKVVPIQIAETTVTYQWSVSDEGESISNGKLRICNGLLTLCSGSDEEASPLHVFLRARVLFRRTGVYLVFLPSYSPARFLALFVAAKSLGIRTVMMNESHAGTEKAAGWKKWLKRQILNHFDSAFVGGKPHKRHFASLGIPADKIFTGYDAIDNDFFISQTDKVREKCIKPSGLECAFSQSSSAIRSNNDIQDPRNDYGLPKRYFLSLGRMVEKKNLKALVEAYAIFSSKSKLAGSERVNQEPVSLVFVGNGTLEASLREQCKTLGLQIISRHDSIARHQPHDQLGSSQNNNNIGTVFFYGFRQIRENATFYALAEAFVLPSLEEEWGLVVNEAMASALPVLISRTAGCAEDLLHQISDVEIERDRDSCFLAECSNGYLFDPSSVNSLEKALWLIAESEERRLAMGKQSREIVAKFSCENFAYQALQAAKAANP